MKDLWKKTRFFNENDGSNCTSNFFFFWLLFCIYSIKCKSKILKTSINKKSIYYFFILFKALYTIERCSAFSVLTSRKLKTSLN